MGNFAGCLLGALLLFFIFFILGNGLEAPKAPLGGRPETGTPDDQPEHSPGTGAKTKFNDYSVNVEELGTLTVCQVTFNSLPPTSEIAAEVVRNAVKELVKKDGSRAIVAIAFDGPGRALPERQYGGTLSYKPGDGQILTMRERDGLQATERDQGTYFVRVEDSKTIVKPVRKWHVASIVFPSKPSGTEARAAVLKEIEKLKPSGLDVSVYVYTGDKSNKITWKQIQAPNGNFMAVEYVARTGKISPNWDWD